MKEQQGLQQHPNEEEPPPILGTWSRVYTVVIGWIVVLITLFSWFTITWNR